VSTIARCLVVCWATVCKRFALCYRTVVCLSVSPVCPVLSVTLVYCGQTAGWIKMKRDTQVGLGPGHIVLDGDQAPLPKNGPQPPIFGSCLLWPNGWKDQDVTWYRGRPRRGPHCVRLRPSSPPKEHRRPLFCSCLLWPNGRPSQLLLSTCTCEGRTVGKCRFLCAMLTRDKGIDLLHAVDRLV